jgi:choloylglycine hydrolase
MKKFLSAFVVLCVSVTLAAMSFMQPADACTSFRIKAKDGTVVIGRSNEYGIDAHSQIVFEPVGREFTSKAPEGKPGKSWKTRYAFLGINGMGLSENFFEGMNEAGLSVEGLEFSDGKYEQVDPKDAQIAVSCNDLVSWFLGNFATVDEVKKELPTVRIWGDVVPAFGVTLNLHFAVHDASGKCLVIEFINGEKKVYDNPIGVMTNMPELPWQLTHLRSYLNMNAFNPKPRDFEGTSITPTGEGSGWFGMPGDWSPPSRFVRMAYLVNTASQAKDVKEACNAAKHILNTVDIVLGSIKVPMKDKTGAEVTALEFTQWSVLNDLTNRVMHYYSYHDMNVKSIDLKKMAAGKINTVKFIPMAGEFSSADMTDKMTGLK